ncbi:Macrosialin [Heterocephalus glaber]|uniref:Macrosialin n=1 Tax=Heterocephalus glaber TaxID=10181 RepID=G5B5C9_HETGA|nr:macrosialin isoform X2 [Heterocephalus glaber]EHB04490.1 Macrosialin [Heterocephalus glaber]
MKLAVLLLASLELLTAQGTKIDWPHKKSATLLPSFTVTPTATKSTVRPTTGHGPTTTSHGNATVHPTSNSTVTTTTDTHSPATTTTSPGNATVNPTVSNGTATSPRFWTSSPYPGPPPPSPSPSPGSKEAIGDYTWTNGSQPCVQLQAQIQIRVQYPTRGGGEAWGISVLNPNKTKVQGGCEGAHTHLLLSFPYGHLSFGFKQDLQQSKSVVYLNYMAVEYNVSFPQAARFSCPEDQSIMLPLIIGLTLLGLLILVLAAFCIIQRRPSAYQPL